MTRGRKLRAGAIAVLAALAAVVLALPAGAQFYDVAAADLPGKPGTVIRIEAMQFSPAGAQAYRVLYRSIGLNGEPIAVSGVVIHPLGPPPAEGRNVVAWAHPTTGVARHCAPSLWPRMFDEIPGLDRMLARGYVVAATDYPGLGTAGVHPYLVGESEGRAVLDIVRAAIAMPETGANERFAIWGHSQGGHATLYAGELARHYAPELTLVGVAAAAPATYLAELLAADIESTSGRLLGAYALKAWSAIYHIALEPVLRAGAVAAFEKTAGDCIEAINQVFQALVAERPLNRRFLKVDITKTEPWRTYLLRNTPGHAAPGIAYFIAQGTADVIVRPPITARFVRLLCRQDARVQLLTIPNGSHHDAAASGAQAAIAWIADRFAGVPAPSNCGS